MPYNGPKEKQEERLPELGVWNKTGAAISSKEELGVYELEQIFFFNRIPN